MMQSDNSRLDATLVERGFFASREKAKATIMSGIVYVNGVRMDKPGMRVPMDASIELRGNVIPYVSRGGLKLAKALSVFEVDVSDKVCADVGASTGGFTDCLLLHGANKVYSIDVGYGQLAWSLRTDSRVICMERTNIRYVTPDDLGERVDLIVVDTSFISVTKFFSNLVRLLKDHGELVILIKPQFEAGRENVGAKGVVRDPAVHVDVIMKIVEYAQATGVVLAGLTFSPITGPEGNIEYLGWFKRDILKDGLNDDKECEVLASRVKRIVSEAHSQLV
jgi:23S rRNA (cytidine1920-2'-O)/16S rRNA (cytidine1409-2'-O)-methyltransferase